MQLGELVLVQGDGHAALDAVAANDGGHGDSDILQTVLADHQARNGQNVLLVAHDGGAEALHGHGDSVVGCVLLVDDLVRSVLDLVSDALLGSS